MSKQNKKPQLLEPPSSSDSEVDLKKVVKKVVPDSSDSDNESQLHDSEEGEYDINGSEGGEDEMHFDSEAGESEMSEEALLDFN